MGSPTSLSDFIVALTNGNSEQLFFMIDNRVGTLIAPSPVQGKWQSLWIQNGFPGQGGAIPTSTARYPDNTTVGAWGQTDPGGGRQKYLAGGCVVPNNPTSTAVHGKLMIYDRLGDRGGYSATVTTAQTTNPLTALTRYNSNATCVGNQLALEINTAIGATARACTISYTNQAGTSARVSQSVVFGGTGAREVQGWIPVPLASGDTGVQAAAGPTVSVSTGTAGDFAVVIYRPLLELELALGVGTIKDGITTPPGLTEVLAGACLAAVWLPSVVGNPQFVGQLSMVEF